MASTYPLEVVQAERWVKQNKSLKGDALKAALEKQTWDDSVKALVPFPDVLTMMSEKLEWTQKLGDAFLAQQKDVMDTVQKLRRKAAEAGNLKSSKEQEVKKEGDIIIVEPANPAGGLCPGLQPHGGLWRMVVPGLSALSGLCLPAGRRIVHVHDGCRHRRGLVWTWVPCRLSRGNRQYRQERHYQQAGQSGDETLRGSGEGARASNGSTTRNTGKGFPTGTRGRATSIPRQTVQPWTTVRVTVVTTSRRQAHPIAPPAGSRPNRIEQPRTDNPTDRVPGQRARTTLSADQTAAGGKRNGTAREAARACLRPSPRRRRRIRQTFRGRCISRGRRKRPQIGFKRRTFRRVLIKKSSMEERSMVLFRMRYPSARTLLVCALALLVAMMFQGAALAAQPKQKTFGTPEAAVEALVKALRDHNEKELLAIFGPGSEH